MYWGDFFSQFPPLYDKYYDPSSTNIKYKPRIVDKKIIETKKKKQKHTESKQQNEQAKQKEKTNKKWQRPQTKLLWRKLVEVKWNWIKL